MQLMGIPHVALICVVSAVALGAERPWPVADRLAEVDAQGVLCWCDTHDEVALFGVNYYPPFWHNYPDLKAVGADHRKVIDQDVAHFARMGLDAIRLHVFDREVSDHEGNLLDNEHLLLLDYLIARARDRGIYTVLTPIAWWPVPGDSPGFSTLYSMQAMTTDPATRKAQTTYLTQFMNHTNRFTGRTYKDDPAVIAFELINEPLYPQGTTDAQVTEYINVLADAVRQTGNHKPVFYNGWGGRLDAVRQARVEGSTFGWYPSGLVAGRSLTRNFLPAVDRHSDLGSASLGPKARIIYEFDAADIPGSYVYPAMARSFRSGGAQIATQFQYDPLPLARFNQGWQTHYLNLVYAPQKAVSFLIAAEAFRRLPRGQDYGQYPTNTRFGAFRVSYEEDLSEMVTEREFFHSNNTTTVPPAPEKLERIIGCGSSPLVRYEGTGAYFLERLADGAWRLEVYPDAVWVDDPYGAHSLDREVSRLIWRQRPMQINMPGLGNDFSVESLNEGNVFRSTAKDGTITMTPGVFLLRRSGRAGADWQNATLAAHVGLREFIVPAAVDVLPAVRHEPRSSWVAGQALPLEFAVVSSKDPDEVVLQIQGADAGTPQRTTLKRDRSYHYVGTVAAEDLRPGVLTYTLEVQTDGRKLVFPPGDRGRQGKWEVRILSPDSAVALFDAERHKVNPRGDVAYTQKLVPGMTDGHRALQVAVEGFKPAPSCITFRTEVSEELDPWRDLLARRTTLHLRMRAVEPTTTAVEVVVVERDGTPWGTMVPLTTEWREVRLPLSSLRHWGHWNVTPAGRGGGDDRVRPKDLAGVSICFGAWLYPEHVAEPHGVQIERIDVE